MSPSAFSILGPPDQNTPWTGKKCVQNFIKIGAGVWNSISPPHTNKQTNICTPIYIYIEED